jgi:hypothetical protein
MECLWGFTYIAVILVAGYTVMRLLLKSPPDSPAKVFALSFGLGAGTVSFIFFLNGLIFGTPPSLNIIIFLFLASLILLFVYNRKNPFKPKSLKFAFDPMAILTVSVIAIMFSVVFLHSIMPLYEWDAFAIWGLKAKVLLHEGLGLKSDYFQNHNLTYSHPEYPLLVPYLMSGACLAGNHHEFFYKIIFPFFYLAFTCLIYTAARWKLKRAHALFITAIFASTPALVRWSGAGTADMILSFFYAGSIIYLIKFFDDDEFHNLMISVLFSLFSAFTKNEGLPLVMINIAALTIFTSTPSLKMKKLKAPVVYISAFLILYLPWLLFSLKIPKLHENYLGNITVAKFAANIGRLPLIIHEMGSQFLSLKNWGLFWILMSVAVIVGGRLFKERAVILLWCMFVGHFLLYALVYIISPYAFPELISQTIDRLYLHLLPVGVLITIMHLSAVPTMREEEDA